MTRSKFQEQESSTARFSVAFDSDDWDIALLDMHRTPDDEYIVVITDERGYNHLKDEADDRHIFVTIGDNKKAELSAEPERPDSDLYHFQNLAHFKACCKRNPSAVYAYGNTKLLDKAKRSPWTVSQTLL